uniref:Uncharacterized protein n=1 Tax=Chromera velia CCMP2878 TaxID=1169474 RepID=A0A0G4HAS0_9ALVE|eukprot:Cvel_6115.t1-p1 / transcript=Cvel_6115.t1 / gene=Cvel_6115 / organism=Chromera_velia_CCMP2878 / gene_product=hypothetical protein / transcript_product=hypothetical protein / location=Cvel_scaffold295:49069-49705(-) / protein_length=94 / sequence_SO=supercontig / SO=protein_coding / is_pseudo=false
MFLHHFTTSLNNRIGYAEGETRRAAEEAAARAAAIGRRGRVQEEDAKMEDVQDKREDGRYYFKKDLSEEDVESNLDEVEGEDEDMGVGWNDEGK